jgi:hypothetical protein
MFAAVIALKIPLLPFIPRLRGGWRSHSVSAILPGET